MVVSPPKAPHDNLLSKFRMRSKSQVLSHLFGGVMGFLAGLRLSIKREYSSNTVQIADPKSLAQTQSDGKSFDIEDFLNKAEKLMIRIATIISTLIILVKIFIYEIYK